MTLEMSYFSSPPPFFFNGSIIFSVELFAKVLAVWFSHLFWTRLKKNHSSFLKIPIKFIDSQ